MYLRTSAAVTLVLASVLPLCAHAQSYPLKNVVLVVPYPPGGGTDLFARVIGQDLAKQFDKQFVGDNRSGANGNRGRSPTARRARRRAVISRWSSSTRRRASTRATSPTAVQPLRPRRCCPARRRWLSSCRRSCSPTCRAASCARSPSPAARARRCPPACRRWKSRGLRGFEALQWHGFFAPAAVPDAIVRTLHAAVVKALAGAEVKSRLAAEGATIVGSTPAEFAAFFQKELVKWTEIAKRAGMQPD